MKESLMPFKLGDHVVERIGQGEQHTDHEVMIVMALPAEGLVRTSLGNWYTNMGRRVPETDSYRSLRSPDYRTEDNP
jgi:hypothetical protein